MASLTCHADAGAKQFRLERTVRPRTVQPKRGSRKPLSNDRNGFSRLQAEDAARPSFCCRSRCCRQSEGEAMRLRTRKATGCNLRHGQGANPEVLQPANDRHLDLPKQPVRSQAPHRKRKTISNASGGEEIPKAISVTRNYVRSEKIYRRRPHTKTIFRQPNA